MDGRVVEAPRGAEGLALLRSVARRRATVARRRATVARRRAAVARRRAAVARRAARVTRCGAAVPRRGAAVTWGRAAVTWGRAAVTGRGSAATGRSSARAGWAAVLGRWRAAVTGRVAAVAWRRSRVAGPASGMPGRGVSLATSGSAVIGRGFSERLRLFALLAARALSVRRRLLGRRSGRARTDRVSVALMGSKRIARNGDRHERVLLRVRVVTDRHLLGVLGRCGGRTW
jgi:hypothetical protein